MSKITTKEEYISLLSQRDFVYKILLAMENDDLPENFSISYELFKKGINESIVESRIGVPGAADDGLMTTEHWTELEMYYNRCLLKLEELKEKGNKFIKYNK